MCTWAFAVSTTRVKLAKDGSPGKPTTFWGQPMKTKRTPRSFTAVRFAEALQKKGARTELVLNEGAGHEVGNPEVVNRRMIAFLNREWNLDMKY